MSSSLLSFFLHQHTAHNVDSMHCALFTATGPFVKMQIKIHEWKRGFEETQTTWLLWPSLPPCVNRPTLTWACFQFAAAGTIYLDVNNCACFASTLQAGPSSTYQQRLLRLDDSGLSAQSSSTPHSLKSCTAEVMPGSRARNPCSEQGYEIRSKFRGLLSRRCNNSINQTGWLLPLVFYKRGFSTFYCYVSWITSRLWLIS